MGSKSERTKKIDKFVALNINDNNWMERMSEHIKETRLVDIRLVRSHQAGSYSINELFDYMSVCQYSSIYYQLYGGVRVLDFRPGRYKNKNDIVVGHGPHSGCSLFSLFEIINEFLSKHKKEFIILEFEKCHKWFGIDHELLAEQKLEVINKMNDIFKDKLITSKDMNEWFDLSKVTMNDIWNNNKQILVISDKHLANHKQKPLLFRNQSEEKGIFLNSDLVTGGYANTMCLDKMINNANLHLNNGNDTTKINYNKLLSANIQMTASSIQSIFNISTAIYDRGFIFNWFKEVKKKRINIIALDFVFSHPQIIKEIINSNIEHKDNFKFRIKGNNDTNLYNEDFIKIKIGNKVLACNKQGDFYLKNQKVNWLNRNILFQVILTEEENIIYIKSSYYSYKLETSHYICIQEDKINKTENLIPYIQGSLFKIEKYNGNNFILKSILNDSKINISKLKDKLTITNNEDKSGNFVVIEKFL